ncbi:MAG: excinuclease ABC subunit UvrA [Vicinamibacteria bacterium]|jgi:excinuclease ABC subunit A|nr:excinuclease ABC subunit UvrA [Vicinamibacteria bacterium]
MEIDRIVITGARQHNLRNITIEIPKKKLVVITGPSGSGKSSLAFDTLYAEGQRRYIESLSAYARQFLGQMDKPLYDSIRGLAPTISIEQKSASSNPRSTVGTITEIHDYLRVLWARVGRLTCHRCGRPVAQQSSQQIVEEIAALKEGTRFLVLAPLVKERKGEHREVVTAARKSGFTRLRVDGVIVSLDDEIRLDKKKKHTIDAVVDRLIARAGNERRLNDAVELALRHGQGIVIVAPEGQAEWILSEHRACHHCGISFPELSPQIFSFNSPLGMCPECSGLGSRLEMDPDLVVPNPALSINEGAVKPLGAVGEGTTWGSDIVRAVAREHGIDLNRAWEDLPAAQRRIILHGTGDDRVRVEMRGNWGSGAFRMRYEGAINSMMRRMRETKSEEMRQYYQKFLSTRPCSACEGQRIRGEALGVKIGERSIAEVTGLSVTAADEFFATLALAGNEATIAAELLKEIRSRLRFLLDVGLGYLTLDRPAPSLSGGEGQRIRLASQIGSELTGVIYVLDEPSIGLHQRDNKKLLAALKHLRDIGNTVVVVEHDREAMEEADWLIDFGPGAGRLGGEIVASGTPAEVLAHPASLTGLYLRNELTIPIPTERRQGDGRSLQIRGARANNLKDVTVDFPLGLFIGVTGVSGAGKSTLINQILYPAIARTLHRRDVAVGEHDQLLGIEHIDKVIDIDQSPIGRTPRSNPATYTKIFDPIREFFAELPEARMHGYSPGRFSFNVKGGRCEACEGDGVKRVEMHFLPDVYVPCEVCHGKRFNEATLAVKYQQLSIADILERTVDEALELFKHHPHIRRGLETLADVGLGYIALGQPSPTLSGGEAQRVKLSRELSKRSTGRTLYILDEPTTGLHFDDIKKLLGVLDRLVVAGNTVIVIEHNLDVIKTVDHVIDLGPEGGEAGGHIVATGTPEKVARISASHTGQYLSACLPQKGGRRAARN